MRIPIVPLVLLAAALPYRAACQDVPSIVRSRLEAEVLQGRAASSRDIARFLAIQERDGSWADIAYGNRARSLWLPAEHLHRLLALALAIQGPGTTRAQEKALREAVRQGMAFWVDRDPQSDNWWWNTIGMQQALVPVLLVSRDDLMGRAPGVWKGACAQVGRSHVDKMTGTNLVWEAGNLLALGALTDDEALIARMTGLITREIAVTDAEGVQADFSFHQHGAQLNAGNYGLSFVPTAARFALLVRGTQLAFPAEKVEVLSGFESQFQEWVVWGRFLDLSSCGRQLDTPNAQTLKARSIAQAGLLLAQLEPSQAPRWKQFEARVDGDLPPEAGAPAGDRYYWRSDFLVHRPGRWYASVRMFSSRVMRTETKVNDENYRGYHLCDGMTQLLVRGDEYENIQPVWDWRKLPGVTFKATTAAFPYGNSPETEHNPSPFVGGAADSGANGEGYAAAAMDIVKEDVSARKGWFCFPGAVVCLGSSISCEAPEPVTTDINQCLLRGRVDVARQDGSWISQPSTTPAAPLGAEVRGVLQDGVGYVLLAPGRWVLSAGPQTGAWSLLRKEGASAAPVTKGVFNLWIDHGIRPRDGSYAYALLPREDRGGMAAFVRAPRYRVLANGDLQAVADDGAGVVEAVFRRPGGSPAAAGLPAFSVDRPCVVIERRQAGKLTFAVADPTQALDRVVLTPASGAPIDVTLRLGSYAGSTAVVSE
jgi:chondroitin AC lyase